MRAFLGRLGSAVGLRSQIVRDLLLLSAFLAAGYVLSRQLNVFSQLEALVKEHSDLPLDQVFGTAFVAGLGLALYCFTRLSWRTKELRKRVEAEDRATKVAMHDQLTGLPNRRHLKGVINWHLSQQGDARKVAAVAISIDGLGQVNDLHGRTVGDELLVRVAEILNLRAGVDGLAARLEGNEFVVMFQNKTDEQLMDWLSAFLTAIEQPVQLTAHEVEIGATVGIAMAPADGQDAETLLHRADMALRRAKEKTRGWFAFFRSGMEERAHERAQFEHDLWRAVTDDQIEPHFQPIVKLESGDVVGYEVLARWSHAERGQVPPDVFIPAAEAVELIEGLTLNVLRRACREAANWPGQPSLSFNLSPLLLKDERLPLKVLKTLREAGFPPARLELEVTETALVTDFAEAHAILASLKNQGVKIALDNFGTGHSSLGQLWGLPVDKLKVDRTFVQAMLVHREASVMVRTIATLAQSLGLTVVAEGVETEAQAKALGELGCQIGQGELYGMAKEASAVSQAPATAPDIKPVVASVAVKAAEALAKAG
ncbi:MAG TPA: EAL domain-containing protein [Hyphomonadaceae bacterium]|nr:EAL domain-containing protein [Hyphomonadaceae bacterium]